MTTKTAPIVTLILFVLFFLPISAYSTVTSWTSANFTSMEHGTDYTWKVARGTYSAPAWFIPDGEHITSAQLFIKSLNNWAVESDYMNIYLVNSPKTPWVEKSLLTTFMDTNEYRDDQGRWANPSEDFTYQLTTAQIATFTSYLSDGKFAIGFDPNCHYYDSQMTFSVTTASVPEPASLLLLGIGFIGAATVAIVVRRSGRKPL